MADDGARAEEISIAGGCCGFDPITSNKTYPKENEIILEKCFEIIFYSVRIKRFIE